MSSWSLRRVERERRDEKEGEAGQKSLREYGEAESAQSPSTLGSVFLSQQGFSGCCVLPSTTTLSARVIVKETSSYFLCTYK